MPFQVPTYSTGTISATTGGHDITITDGAWVVAGQTNVSPGDTLVSQNSDYTIREVVSATLLRIDPPWSGTSGGDKTFVVYKRVPTGSSELFGIISTLLSWGGAAAPFPQVYGDDGVLRWVLRNDGAGNVALFVGNSGAADGAMTKALEFNRTTGAVRFPFGAALGSAAAPTYTFVGDLNTGMWSPAADQVAVSTNGVERLRVNASGNVVINETQANLGMAMRLRNGALWVDRDATGLFGDWDNRGQLILRGQTNTDKRLGLGVDTSAATMFGVVQAMEAAVTVRPLSLNPIGGNVGVNTSTPPARLTIVSANQGNASGVAINGSDVHMLLVMDSSDNAGRIQVMSGGSASAIGTTAYALKLQPQGGETQIGGTLRPLTDNTQNVGTGSFRFATFFAGTGTINTSDATQKRVRGTFTDDELDAWGDTRPLIFRWEDAYARKGDDARLHAGLIAQEVEAAFAAYGLDAAHYGLWCKDAVTKRVTRTVTQTRPKTRTVTEQITEIEIRDGVPVQVTRTVEREETITQMVAMIDERGAVVMQDGEPLMHPVPVMEEREVEITEDEPDGYRLGLRYDQCAIFEAAWTRRELARLQARVEALEGAKRKPRSTT